MKLISIDPASRKSGYAISTSPTEIVDAGCLVADARRVPVERVRSIVADVLVLIATHGPTHAVIEVAGGKVHRSIRSHRPVALDVWGMAVGAVLATLDHCLGPFNDDLVMCVTPNGWTRGEKKSVRQQRIGMEFPAYGRAMSKDKGADVADAIALGQWWWSRRRAEALAS